jgi:hypothetical protein
MLVQPSKEALRKHLYWCAGGVAVFEMAAQRAEASAKRGMWVRCVRCKGGAYVLFVAAINLA